MPSRTPSYLVIAPPMRVMYCSPSAREVLGQSEREASGHARHRSLDTALPEPLVAFCSDLWLHMQARLEATCLERFEITQTLRLSQSVIRVRGIGLPDRRGGPYSRLCLLLDQECTCTTPEIG